MSPTKKKKATNYPAYNKTKIIATIGPASSDYSMLKKLIEAGVDVCRINFSHGELHEHLKVIENIRKINEEMGLNICILGDLQGPKLRIGEIEGGFIQLKRGEKIILTSEKKIGNKEGLYISYKHLIKDVKPGEKILLDDGKIELKFLEKLNEKEILAQVLYGGLLKSRKGFNLPNSTLSIPSLTEKDKQDLTFALENDIDWIGLSFVREAKDIEELRTLIDKSNPRTRIIAKIEKPQAVSNFKAILKQADGIMVARGDLGVEMPMQKVPVIQKKIVQKCIEAAKPVIIATQMMESMIESSTPTRAEVNDVANAVLDGADAVMLSAETSIGKYPLKTIQVVEKILGEVEINANPYYKGVKPRKDSHTFISDEVCFTAVRMSEHLKAKTIVGMTHSGYTGHKVSSYRPNCDIFIFTHNRPVLRTLNLVWGIRGYYYDEEISTDRTIQDAIKFLAEKGFVKKGDIVINCASMPLHAKQRTNTLKVSVV
ncbi:MAG: pyruvate kinase [Flavobacteriales bacterium]|nr:pyruvate kinase [Flavobacteriales bacterium]